MARDADAGRSDDMLVRVENVRKQYRLGDQTVTALAGVNLNIEEGVFMAIAGPSGSGKSTLLNLIGCIDTPSSGRIVIAGRDVSGRTPDELARLRGRAIGFIFQTFNLLPVLSAAENVEYPLLQFKELGAAERRERVAHYLGVVGLTEQARQRPNQLSGGQRQRVAIARALAVRPKIILADEPTANLDHKTGMRILRLMRSINRKSGATFVFSTHDKRVIDMADRRVDLEDGEIVRLGVRRGKKEWGFALERPEPDDDVDDEGLTTSGRKSTVQRRRRR
jgi:putative ABC transport system ATP-binding protein